MGFGVGRWLPLLDLVQHGMPDARLGASCGLSQLTGPGHAYQRRPMQSSWPGFNSAERPVFLARAT